MNQGMFCNQPGHKAARWPVSDPPLSSIRARDSDTGHDVAFRLVPEWRLIDLNGLTGPHWSGKYALAPEKYGIGPEKLRSEWSR
jgi:hypothetical protein